MTFLNTLTRNSDTSYYYSNFQYRRRRKRKRLKRGIKRGNSRAGLVTFQKKENRLVAQLRETEQKKH